MSWTGGNTACTKLPDSKSLQSCKFYTYCFLEQSLAADSLACAHWCPCLLLAPSFGLPLAFPRKSSRNGCTSAAGNKGRNIQVSAAVVASFKQEKLVVGHVPIKLSLVIAQGEREEERCQAYEH